MNRGREQGRRAVRASGDEFAERLVRDGARASKPAPRIDLSALPRRSAPQALGRAHDGTRAVWTRSVYRTWAGRGAAAALLLVAFGHAPHEAAGVSGRQALQAQPRVERELRLWYWSAARAIDADAEALRAELGAFAGDAAAALAPARGLVHSLGAILPGGLAESARQEGDE